MLYLAVEHHNEPVAKNNQSVGNNQRVAAVDPIVKFVFLGQNMDAA